MHKKINLFTDVEDVTAKTCSFSWIAPEDDGGADINGYVMLRRELGRKKWTKINSDVKSDVFKYEATELFDGREYEFGVSAVNKYGIGEPASTTGVVAKDPFSAPCPPDATDVCDVTENSMTVMWHEPRSDGGKVVSGYYVEMRAGSDGSWIRLNNEALDAETFSYHVDGLQKDEEYYFRVLAENIAGISKASEPSEPVMAISPIEPPSRPGKPSLLEINKTSCKLFWSEPELDGGCPVSHYVILLKKRDVGANEWKEDFITWEANVKTNEHEVVDLIQRNMNTASSKKVYAVNKAGQSITSEESDTVTCKPKVTAPDSPRELKSAGTTKTSVTLQWMMPDHDGGSGITGYVLQKREQRRQNWQDVVSIESTEYTEDNLKEGSSFEYRVAAVNAIGQSEWNQCKAVTAACLYSVPGKPRSLRTTSVSRYDVDLVWREPVFDGGADIACYSIEKKNVSGQQQWVEVERTNDATCKYKCEKIEPFAEVQFRIIAINEAGSGEPSEPTLKFIVRDPILPPGQPTNVTMVTTSISSVTLKWCIPSLNGGDDILGYYVERCLTGGEEWIRCNVVPFSKPLGEITGLRQGRSYNFRVCAYNSAGLGKASGATEEISVDHPDCAPTCTILDENIILIVCWREVATEDRPGEPEEPIVSDICNESCVLSWKAPTDDGGSAIMYYSVEKREVGRRTWKIATHNTDKTTWKVDGLIRNQTYNLRVTAYKQTNQHPKHYLFLGGNHFMMVEALLLDIVWISLKKTDQNWIRDIDNYPNTEYTVENLTPELEYEYRVYAKNKAGVGEPAQLPPIAAKDPIAAPTVHFASHLKKGIEVRGGAELTLTATYSGVPKPSIRWVQYDKEETDVVCTPTRILKTTDDTVELHLGPCTRADKGKYFICLENEQGRATASVEVFVTDVPDICSIPWTFEDSTKEAVTIYWKPPADNGGFEILNYVVEVRESNKKNWSTLSATITCTRWRAQKLVTGTEYIFRVAAENKLGVGPWLESEPYVAKMAFDEPGAPEKPNVVDVTRKAMLVNWNEPNDGGSSILGYHLERKDVETGKWTRVVRDLIRTNEYQVITGLYEDSSYRFRVCAENAAGLGNFSPESDVFTCQDPASVPAPPCHLKVTDVTNNSVTLKWELPSYSGGDSRIFYEVERQLEDGSWQQCFEKKINALSCTITSLEEGQVCNFRVKAVNRAGESKPAEIEVTVKEKIVHSGKMIEIMANVTGRPAPEISWQKDSESLPSHVEVVKSEKGSLLRIQKCQRSDWGQYTVTAKNVCGTKTTTCLVNVLDIPGPVKEFETGAITKSSVALSWRVPSDDGGLLITRYFIEKRDTSMKAWLAVKDTEKFEVEASNVVVGCTYAFRICAENDVGKGPWVECPPVLCEDPLDVPSHPEYLRVVEKKNTYLLVKWNASRTNGGSAIKGYMVDKQQLGHKEWTPCNSRLIEKTGFKVEELLTGMKYVIRVKAVNNIGESNPAFTLPTEALEPAASPDVTLDIGANKTLQVRAGDCIHLPAVVHGVPEPEVKWVKDKNTILEKESDHMKIVRNGKEATIFIPKCARQDDGIYHITATNYLGTKTVRSIVTVYDVPAAPQNVRLTKVTSENLVVQWDPPVDNGGAELFNYVVEKREGKNRNWIPLTNAVIETKFRVKKLTFGVEYHFRVAAENRIGVGAFTESPSAVAKNPYETPDSPGKPIASEITKSSMLISWQTPKKDGGAVIEGYWLEVRDNDTARWRKVTRSPIVGNTKKCSYKINQLDAGIEYRFRVSAVNKAGVGPKSEDSDSYIAQNPIYPPGQPFAPKITDVSATSMSLTWFPPKFDGGSEITGYYLERCDEVEMDWVKIILGESSMINTTKVVVPNLQTGYRYQFRITACNVLGAGIPSMPSRNTQARDIIEPPSICMNTGLRNILEVRAGTTIKLVANVSGCPQPSVQWKKDDKENIPGDCLQERNKGGDYFVQIHNCNRNHSGTYTIVCQNSGGSRFTSCKVQVIDTPGQPENMDISHVTSRSATLHWKEPGNNGGSRIQKYIVEKRRGDATTWTKVESALSITECVVSDLLHGYEYEFRVCAVNATGQGPYIVSSKPTLIADPVTTPDAPTLLKVISITATTVSLKWVESKSYGNLPLKTYLIQQLGKGTEGEEIWNRCNKEDVLSTEYTIKGISKNEQPEFRVLAVNDVGSSPPSNKVGPVECKDDIVFPVIEAVEFYEFEFGCDVEISAKFVGFPKPVITWQYFEQEIKKSERISLTITSSETHLRKTKAVRSDTGLYIVTAKNIAGKVSKSIKVNVIGKPGPPSKPFEFTKVSSSTIAFFWNPVQDDGGSRIKYYAVEKREIDRDSWHPVACPKDLAITDTELMSGKEYIYRIRSINQHGCSTWLETDPVLAKNPCERPERPDKPSVKGVTRDAVTVYWNAPENDGGSVITSYALEKRSRLNRNWRKVTTEKIMGTQFRAGCLQEGQEYVFRVAAINEAGQGDFSLVSSPVIAANQIDCPGSPKPIVTNTTKTTVSLAWNIPDSDGGSRIKGYVVERKDEDDEDWLKITGHELRSTSFVAGELKEGGRYNFRVSAINDAGRGLPGLIPEIVVVGDKHEAPVANFDSTIKKNKILARAGETIRLNAVIDGKPDPYILWKKDDEQLPEEARLHDSSRTVVIRNCQRRHTGCYVLKVVNPAGESQCQVDVSIQDIAGPCIGPLSQSDITKHTVTLSWEAPEDDGGCTITNYVIEKRESSRRSWTRVPMVVTRTTAVVRSLIENESYMFRVSAENIIGVGPTLESSLPVTARDPVSTPGRPEEIRVSDVTKDSVTLEWKPPVFDEKKTTINVKILGKPSAPVGPVAFPQIAKDFCRLSWNPPIEDGGAEITHYIVEKKDMSRISWVPVYETLEKTSCAVKKLMSGSEYMFRVSAVNKYGIGPALLSSNIVAKNQFSVPEAPGAPEVISTTKDSVCIIWTRPDSDGGSDITNYIVERRQPQGRWLRCTKDKSLSDLRYNVTSLRHLSYFEFRVCAENAAGLGAFSDASIPTKVQEPLYPPAAPARLRVTNITNCSISLAWSVPTYDGGCPIDGYILEMAESVTDEEENWEKVHKSKYIKAMEYNVVGLTKGREYIFRVFAVNEISESEVPAKISDPIVTKDILEEPAIELSENLNKVLCVKAGRSLILHVGITGRPVPSVTWSKTPCGEDLDERSTIEGHPKSSVLKIAKCDRYDAGIYTVTAENSSGRKEANITVKVLDTPGRVSTIEIEEVTKSSVTISWKSPEIVGGSDVKSYVIERREQTRRTWNTVENRCTSTSFKVDGLQEGVRYYFKVTPENEFGIGEERETEKSVLACEQPSPPASIEVTDITNNSVTLLWKSPCQDGGTPIEGYQLEVKEKDTDKWKNAGSTSQLKHVVKGLKEGKDYFFRVKAKNASGFGEPKELLSSVTIKEQPEKPAIKIIDSSKHVSKKGGEDILLKFSVCGRPQPAITWHKNAAALEQSKRINFATDDGVTTLAIKEAKVEDLGEYKLTATNDVGKTSEIVIVTILDVPSSPTGPVDFAEVTGNSLVLTWQPPLYDGGAMITNYKVERKETHGRNWTVVSDIVTRTCMKVTKLEENGEYIFRISAENRFGVGKYLLSESVVVKNRYGVPGPPSSPQVLEVVSDAISLCWMEPVNNGGLNIIGYIVERKEKKGKRWIRATRQPVKETRFTSTGLIEGIEYIHRVFAVNEKGEGKPSKETVAVLCCDPVDPPSAPRNPRVVEITKSTLSLAWDKPESEGGSKVSGYFIEMRKGEEWWERCNTTPIRFTHYSLKGMTDGGQYLIRLMAVNAGGVGDAVEMEKPIVIKDESGLPKFIVDDEVCNLGITVEQGDILSIPVKFKSQPKQSVTWLKQNTKDEDFKSRCSISVNESFTELLIKKVTPADAGFYGVRLENKCGVKEIQIPVVVCCPPAAPEGPIVFSNITPNSVSVSWKETPSIVEKYIVKYREEKQTVWVTAAVVTTGTSCTIKGLIKDERYYFQIAAVNQYGRSPVLELNQPLIPTIKLLVPKPPQHVEINEVTKDKICVSWMPVLEDGGSPISGYYVQCKEVSSDSWCKINKVLTKNNCLTVQDVVENAEYEFCVVAVNSVGDSEPSATSESVICKDPDDVPSPPEDLEVQNLTRNSITLAWNEPSFRGVTPILGYIVEVRKPDSTIWECTHEVALMEPNHQICELDEDTAYEIRVIAVNDSGKSRPAIFEKPIVTKKPVGEPPLILEPLSNENCTVGDTAILACRISGKPEPKISWWRNGVEMSTGGNIKILAEGEMHSIHINNVTVLDSGEYTITAKNSIGKVESISCVAVNGSPVVDDKFNFQENISMKAGEQLDIHVPYLGLPKADAMWSKGGLSVQPGENCTLETTNMYAHLQLSNVTRSDCGKYTVVLSNIHGKNTYSVNCEVYDKPTKPRDLAFSDITDSSLSLIWNEPEDCGGSPVVQYIIEKCEQNVEPLKWELVTSRAVKTEYKVEGLTQKHSYIFRVTAKSKYGLSEAIVMEDPIIIRTPTDAPLTPTNISVNGITSDACILNWKQPKTDRTKVTSYIVEKRDNKNTEWSSVTIDTITETVCCVTGLLLGQTYEFRITSENDSGKSDPSEPTPSMTPKENVRVVKPRFMEQMRDIVAKPGQNVTLFSKISGQPKPIIKWYKGGREVVQDSKHQMRYGRGNNYSMNISRACIEDEGPYTIRAINVGGSTSCTINITIHLPARVLLPRYMLNEATHCKVHESVSLKVPIEGSPMPKVTWSKAGKQITQEVSGYNIVTTSSSTTLMIKDAWRSDSGFYNITLDNRFGSHQATVQLLVADKPGQPERLKVSGISRDSVDLSWTAPSDDGGKAILKYIIEKSLVSSERWMKVSSSSTTRYTLCGLSGRTSYLFRIRAENECGQSSPSTPSGIITTKEDPTMAATYDEMVDVSGDVDSKNAKTQTNVNVLSKYNLLEELGRGAFGNVHRAQEISSGKIMAAKIVKTDDEHNYASVKREIAVMKKLNHPNLLQLHEIFEAKGEFTMIVQFVSGGDLFERITSDLFDLTEDICIQLIKQITMGLAFMHDANIVHLDLKPENVLFVTRKSNNLKLVDFGASRELRSGEALKIAYGTPDFCAPEVITNDSVGRATDMWSLGVLTYILLSGVSPFKGENDSETLKNVSDAEWDFNHEAWANISDEALDFVDRLLIREKCERMFSRDALLHPWLSSDIENVEELVAEKRSQVIPTMLHRKFFKANIIFEASTVVVSLGRLAYGGSLRSCKGKSVSKLKVETVNMNPCLAPLHHQFVAEGGDAKLESKIYDAEGDEDITWFKGNIRLEESEKYQFAYDEESDKFSLIVRGVQKSDDSTYRCKVENGFGTSSQQCELCVQLKSGKWTRVPRIIYISKHKKIAKRSGGEVMRSLRHAPEFTLPLYNRTVYAGESVTFSVTVTVHPTPEITWYHNAQKVKISSDNKKYVEYQEKGLYRLTICDCDFRDGGDLLVIARNKYGEDMCKASLVIKRKPSQAEVSLRPTFRRLMANQYVHEGQSAKFDIRVAGYPKPEVTWEKDGKLLRADNHHEMVWEDQQSCYLLIKDVFRPDAGMYKATARNSAGAASSKALLSIKKPIKRIDEYVTFSPFESKGYKKADILAALKGGDTDQNLPESARLALLTASSLVRSGQNASSFLEDEDAEEKRAKIKYDKLVASLPYSVPQPIEHNDNILEEDKELLSYEPRSATRWYRKVQASNELYIGPDMSRGSQRSYRVKKHVNPDKAYVIPERRITTMKVPTQENFEEDPKSAVARFKNPTKTEDESRFELRRKFYHPMADDEKYLQPVDEYLMEQSSIEYLAEEAAMDSAPIRVRRQNSDKDVSISPELTYTIPSKDLETRSFSKMRERHDAVENIGKSRSSMKKDPSEDNILRPMALKISQYGSRQKTEIPSLSTSSEEIGGMSWYQKRLQKMKMKPTAEELAYEEGYECEVSNPKLPKATLKNFTQGSTAVRRRSFEFEELTRPVSEMFPERKRWSSSSSSSSSDIDDEVTKTSPRVTKSGVRFSELSPENSKGRSTHEAPKFQLKMRSHVVSAGMNTKFTAAVKAMPQANIRWQKDGMLIFADGDKYRMSDVNGVISLEIKNCGREDTGSYRCLARNEHGEVSAYATLEVTGSNSRDYKRRPKSTMNDDDWRRH
uniref:titin-like n=1 Tax=Styela clava TaxID=7725 RepID=UPI001939DF2B|nr:titin-like [Styela clava]